jgi:hypothetical protein
VEALLNEAECPPDRVLKASHALAQLAGAYSRVVESTTFEERLRAVEERLHREEVSRNGRH